MEQLVNYFENMPSLHRSFVLIGGLTIFFLLENAAPLFRTSDKGDNNKWAHSGLNIFFTATTIVVNLLLAFILLTVSDWVVANEFGLLQWISMPLVVFALVGVLLLDLIGAYFAHWTEHHVKWMWQFHVIHHTDQYVDTTTANRHHPGESVIRLLFTTLAVFIAGAPIWLVMLYQSMSVLLSQFNHSNLSVPGWLDKLLLPVFCTPDMHRVHHHYRQPYSDSNYGNIFSFWDRLFGTYQQVDNSKLIYGVDTYMDPAEATSVGNLLQIPFKGHRPHIKYEQEEKLN